MKPIMVNAVSDELKRLVFESLKCLGDVIKTQEGEAFYNHVEATRLLTRGLRDASDDEIFCKLQIHLAEWLKDRHASHKLQNLTKAFGLALELVNTCENTYRSARILREARESGSEEFPDPTSITWVFTAHPTEARTQGTIEIFRRIQELLGESLAGERTHFPSRELKYLLTLAWHTSLAPTTKPSVEDEARHILHQVLADEALDIVCNFTRETRHRLRLRSWVGGDKDGHPGVSAPQTFRSLQLSRAMIVPKVIELLDSLVNDLKKHEPLIRRQTLSLKKLAQNLHSLRPGDNKRVALFKESFAKTLVSAKKLLGTEPAQLLKIASLLELFPAFVLPLEMREDAAVLREIIACKPAQQRRHAIVKMLEKVRSLSGTSGQDYLQGFVISQCNSAQDFRHALALGDRYLKDPKLPIVPLFENREALDAGAGIVQELLADKEIRARVSGPWQKKLEIMVGYSDSAKEMGVLSSRYLIAKTLPEISAICKKHDVTPIFFHGSGGSISRGGGSTSEQCAWWPREARARIKMTVQGEMVQRTFASGPILTQNLKKLLKQNQIEAPRSQLLSEASQKLIATQEQHYETLIREPQFLKLVADATPYEYLQHLQIGSRPAKRKKLEGITSLRAIPWVLCWTQTRSLLPIWWGLGSAWRAASLAERKNIAEDFRKSPFLSSFVKQLGFSLAKVEPGIWRLYLENLAQDRQYSAKFSARFDAEFLGACQFVRELSGVENLLWFRPWLGASIRVRSPMIFPLHLAQLWALKNHDVVLMRQTVTTIASGMLTTG